MPKKDRVPHIARAIPEGIEPFVSDSPLTDPQLDRFRRFPFAERLANTLAQRRDPTSTVILINGKWGEGKTTLLQYVHATLYRFDNVVPIWFNPWRFSDETSLLLSFFATVASALDRSNKTKKEKIGDLFRDYGAVVGEIAVEAYGVKLSTGKVVSKIGEKLSTVSLEDKRKHIADMLGKSGKRIVVFLDDIDRLDRIEAQAVFKLLKLTANFEHVSYVLAFDRDVVAAAIGEQFGQGDKQAGYDYLEKIVQVNLDLPVADRDALAQLCIDGVNDALRIAGVSLTPDQNREFQLAFLQYIVPALNTPRLAKLYANSVAFVLPLLAREVNPVDLLILEAIRFLYPLLHQDIRTAPQIYTGEFGWDLSHLSDRDASSKQHLTQLLERAAGPGSKRAQRLLTDLFPQLQQLFRSSKYGERSEEHTQRDQRVSSLDYLWRYLTCSIPAGDISDQEIDHLLQAFAMSSGGDIEAKYCDLIRLEGQTRLITKLRRRSEDMPAQCAEKLARIVAKHGSEIQGIPDAIVQPIALAALLIRESISRLEGTRRYDVAMDVLRSAEPIFFAVLCLDWMRPQRGSVAADAIFSTADLSKLTVLVADRIALHASTASIISQEPEYTARLLTTWQQGHGSQPVKDHVRGVLAAEPTAVEQFIRPFSSFVRTGMSGMDQVGYDLVIKFVDPDVLMTAFESTGLLGSAGTDGIARIAQQFAAIYQSEQARARDIKVEKRS